ncbi:Utp11 domain-containing protein [Rhizoctonia solani AG-1 IA]|uniref:Utp11 domain-containing protein n=1 Tax=Thanatephorus cucumeris (strain AG1-IA) TaxID=983506 RepID=L8WJY1_THACA|nr:Utp11 domain-containing protein [Rhizoctonia solani AG-1 IA]
MDTLRSAGVLPSTKPISRKWEGKAVQSTPRHVVFVDNQEQAMNYTGPSGSESPAKSRDQWSSEDEGDNTEDWTEDTHQDDESGNEEEDKYSLQRAQKQELKRQAAAKKHRLALLQELSARLKRDTVLRHTLRELELQKSLMAPGARTKIRGPERVEQGGDGEDGGSTKKRGEVKFARQGDIDYTPRVYKWRSEPWNVMKTCTVVTSKTNHHNWNSGVAEFLHIKSRGLRVGPLCMVLGGVVEVRHAEGFPSKLLAEIVLSSLHVRRLASACLCMALVARNCDLDMISGSVKSYTSEMLQMNDPNALQGGQSGEVPSRKYLL